MRKLTLLLTLLTPAALAQSPLLARLRATQTQTSLDDPTLKPWHLKLAVQLFDAKGAPSGQSTIEEWWSSPLIHKIIYSGPTYNVSMLHNDAGFFETKDASYPPFDLSLLLNEVVHPMPPDSEMASSKPDLRPQHFGKLALDCIMLDRSIPSQPYPPLGLFPTYCLTPDTGTLRLSYNYGSQLIVFNAIGKFQGRSVGTAVDVKNGDTLTATARVVTLETAPADSAAFTATEGMEPGTSHTIRLGSGVIAGSKIGGDPPRYPEDAKQHHISGSVVLHAIIGRDGHIQALTPVASPDASLTIAALAAVRTWTYKPYLLNGVPTEVDTLITVNFSFGC